MVTISDVEIPQEFILRGNMFWSDLVYSKTNSELTALIDMGCYDYSPISGTIRFSLNNTFRIPYDQAESYTIRLTKDQH